MRLSIQEFLVYIFHLKEWQAIWANFFITNIPRLEHIVPDDRGLTSCLSWD